jgi:serine/threonine protein kinase
MPNGSLEDVLTKAIEGSGPTPFTRLQALEWAMQISDGINVLHRRGFVHRDIKPDNILLSEIWTAVVADLGTVKLDTFAEKKREKMRHINKRSKSVHVKSSRKTRDVGRPLSRSQSWSSRKQVAAVADEDLFTAPTVSPWSGIAAKIPDGDACDDDASEKSDDDNDATTSLHRNTTDLMTTGLGTKYFMAPEQATSHAYR